MADRRKSQNFTALPDYFTDPLWDLFHSSAYEKSQVALFRHAWLLGLRCPSEATYAVIYNVLNLVRPTSSTRSVSSFERYQKIGEVKKAWRKFKQVMKPQDMNYMEYLELLPQHPGDLPDEYQEAAFADAPAVQSRILVNIYSILFYHVYILTANIQTF